MVNSKYYVGMHSTNNLNDGYIGSGRRLWYSMKKYGKNSFVVEILEFLHDRRSLREREKMLINDDLLKDPMCMNIGRGGEGGIMNDEHERLLHIGSSIYLKKMWEDGEYRTKTTELLRQNVIRNHKLGKMRYDTFTNKKHTTETKELMSLAHKGRGLGRDNSQYGTCWITNGVVNKKIKRNDADNFIKNGWRFGRV